MSVEDISSQSSVVFETR